MNSTILENYLLNLIQKTVIDNVTNPNRSKSIHVTSMTAPCMRRQYYDLTRPKKPLDFKTAGIFRVGQIMHSGIVLSKDRNEYSMAGNIRTMEPITVDQINPINFFDCISGTIDDLMTINGEEIIVDKKTFSSKTYTPVEVNQDYITQLNIYKLLYFITTKKEVKKGVIIYMDVATRLEKTLVFEIQLDSIESIKSTLLNKLDILKSNQLPPRIMDWHCKFCPWNNEEVCNPKTEPNYESLVNPPRKPTKIGDIFKK